MRIPTILGRVESATGSTVTVGLDDETLSGLVYIEGQGHRVGQVGSFVRIPQGFADLFGLVTQAGVAAAPASALESGDSRQARRWLTVEIVGEGRHGTPFARGVFRYPTIGDEVHLVTEEDLAVIYGATTSREYVEVGSLASARSIPARVDVNKLVTRHCAVVGATGSGKSTTVAGIIGRLCDKKRLPAARILMLDIHGEYAAAFQEDAQIFKVNPDSSRRERPLQIPFWALKFDELLPLTFGEVDDYARGFLIEWITSAKRARVTGDAYKGLEPSWVTVDTPLPFSLRQLWYDLRWEIDATYPRGQDQTKDNAKVIDKGDAAKLLPARFTPYDGTNAVQTRSPLAIRKPLDTLLSRMRDPRMRFLFEPGPWTPQTDHTAKEDLDSLLASWLGDGGASSLPITILDLSGIPTSILTDLVGALLRLLFDALFWGRTLPEGGRERPLLIVMEEAHTYLSDPKSLAALAAKRIVKEGRKYGVGAMIVSQRPTEIDTTILSQCGTFFALRMGNAQDRNQVGGATTDGLRGLLDLLPTLRTGEAIVVGEAVQLPTRVAIHAPPENRRPSSDDPRVVETEFEPGESGPGGWDRQLEQADYRDLVLAWRRQDAVSPKLVTKEK
ncbi:MAG TPA: helicase HerA-like domain-containing protein [Terriglobales bacterium]|nr:helicase HerA-like domain-containing protein [Terriglobales bacterium]